MVKVKLSDWQLEYVEFPPDMRERVDIPEYQREVNLLDLSGFSPLHWAIIRNSKEKVLSLIEFGADVNLKDFSNTTPLDRALSNPNSKEIAFILIENGAFLTKNSNLENLPDRETYINIHQENLENLVQHLLQHPTPTFRISFCYPRRFSSISQLEFLEEISLNFNNLITIPLELFELKNLIKIDLSNNLITDIPPNLSVPPKLKYLSLSYNFLRDCNNLFQFEKLHELIVNHNQIHIIPKEISLLKWVYKLDFSFNFINFITPSLMELTQLEYINLSYNDITIFDFEIHTLPLLSYFNISHNKLIKMQFDEIMANPNLKTFKYEDNYFPKEIVRILDTHYYKSFSLDLSCLGISTLRKEILYLNLRELNLRNNNLTMVPEEIGQLSNLQILDLSYNRIKDLPLFIYRLSQLQELRLEETKNYITHPPRTVIDRGLKCIMGYYADLLNEFDPCFRMKLMLVGQENVGKSSLLFALLNKKKRQPKKNISTDGIDIERWTIKTPNKQAVTFSVWDFAGQEIYYTTHSFFLSTKAIYLLLWDLRYSDETSRVEFWLNSVTTRSNKAPVILCGTHLDFYENNPEKVQSILVGVNEKFSKYHNIVGITAISTVTLENLNSLIDLITKTTLECLDRLATRLPKIYLTLEEQVFILKDKENPPAISWSSFTKLASNISFKDEEQLLRATNFLHDLGSLVLFENDEISDRLIVLDPQWLTKMFASVITTSHQYIKNGVLKYSDLNLIWRPPLYPPSLHPQLINILEQFEILLELPTEEDGEDKGIKLFLVPSLLPLEKPPIDLLWIPVHDDSAAEQFTRTYRFEFIPSGLFSRFVVRFLHFSDKPLKYWRNGILAQKANNKALVEIFNDQIIHVMVRGDKAAEYLRVIIEIINILAHSWFKTKIHYIHISCPHCLANSTTSLATSPSPIEPPLTISPPNSPQLTPHSQVLSTSPPSASLSLPSNAAISAVNAQTPNLSTSPSGNSFPLLSSGAINSVSSSSSSKPNNASASSSSSFNDSSIFEFDLTQCEEAIAKANSRVLVCGYGKVPVRIDMLAPELVMADFDGCQIDFREIEVDKELGKGAFGIIYKGIWKGEEVAIKRLKVEEEAMAIAAFTEFRKEVWVMSGLSYPCIVNLKGYTLVPLSMVMECVPGGDLYQFIHNKNVSIDWQLRMKLALDIASGMNFLHKINPPILHRDLKSPNVLILDHKNVQAVALAKVADFGLSERLFVEKLHDRVVENPTWCAPEILKKKPYTEKADIYSYGVILWELLTRKLPFDTHQFQHKVEDDVIRGVRPGIPDDCWPPYADLIRNCWHDDPNRRPSFSRIISLLINIIDTTIGRSHFRYRFPPSAFPSSRDNSQDRPSVVLTGSLAKKIHTDCGDISCVLSVDNQVWCGTLEGTISIFSAESGKYLTKYYTTHTNVISALTRIQDRIWSAEGNGQVGIWKIEDLVTEDVYDTKVKIGYLLKRGGDEKKRFRKWQQRWVQLFKSGYLRYYRHEGDAIPAGEILLKSSKIELSAKNIYIITKDRKYTFQAKSEEEATGWSIELHRAIGRFIDGPVAQELVRKLFNGNRVTSLCEIREGEVLVGAMTNIIRLVDTRLRAKAQVTINLKEVIDEFVTFFLIVNTEIWVAVNRVIVRLSYQDELKEIDQLSMIHTSAINNLIKLPDNNVWSAGSDGNIVRWDAKTGQYLSIVTSKPKIQWMSLLLVDDDVWVAGTDPLIFVIDSTTNAEKKELSAHDASITSLVCTFNGLIWSTSFDHTICIWN